MERTAVLEQIQPLIGLGLRKIDHGAGARVIIGKDDAALKPSKGAQTITLNDEGYKNLLSFAGIPIGMDDKLCPDTRSRVANEILAKKKPYSVILKDKQIIDIASSKQERSAINPEKVLRTVEKSLSGDVDYHRVYITGAVARIELTTDTQERVVAGDMIKAGAALQFSPLGVEIPSVESFIVRLICNNGAISDDVFQKYGYGEGDDVWHFFRNSVRAAVQAVAGIAARFREMIEDKIPADQRAMVLEAMIKEARLSPNIAGALRARAISEPPRNAYDVMNMITYASSHDIQEPEQIVRAQRAVSKFVSEKEHKRICPACHEQK